MNGIRRNTMKTIIKIVSVALISLTLSNASYAYGYSTPNIFGGYNYYGNDGMNFYTTPNIFGGYNYHNNSWGW